MVEAGVEAGTSFTVTTFPAVLGRSSQADVRIPDDAVHPTMSRQHARLHVRGGRLYIEDISSTGTRVGDRELVPREVVAVQDQVVWLGPRTRLRISLSAGVSPRVETDTDDARPLLAIRCLGGFSVEVAGTAVSEAELETRKASLLLALLADSQSSLAAETVAERLWPDSPDGGKTVLQTTVSRIRRAFRKKVATLPDPVQFTRGSYSLNTAYRLVSDVAEFESLCSQGLGRSDEAVARLEGVLTLYRGPYLEGFSGDWVEVRRTILQSQFSDAVLRLGRWHEAAGRHEEAQRTFERLVRQDPCDELGREGVMRCLAARGRREEAIRQYIEAERHLEKALQVTPGPALTALYQSLMRGQA